MTDYRDIIQTESDLQTFAAAMTANNIAYTWSGLCLWVDIEPAQMTGAQTNALHLLGARYSQKRNRYYLRSNGTLSKAALS